MLPASSLEALQSSSHIATVLKNFKVCTMCLQSHFIKMLFSYLEKSRKKEEAPNFQPDTVVLPLKLNTCASLSVIHIVPQSIQLEEERLLASGRTKIPGLKVRMELAWQKEREEQQRLLQETATLARDLRQTLFEVVFASLNTISFSNVKWEKWPVQGDSKSSFFFFFIRVSTCTAISFYISPRPFPFF